MNRVLPLRLCLISFTVFLVSAAYNAENEQVYALRGAGGLMASAVMLGMLALSVLALVDICLSERQTRLWTWVRRRRWTVWMLMACGHAMQAAVAAMNGYMPWLAGQFFMFAGWCAVVAVLDVHNRGVREKVDRQATGLGSLDTEVGRQWLV